MKKIFLHLFLLSTLFAYEKGDVIDSTLAAHLGCTEDKIYIVDFFASWCGSCKKEIPLLSKVNTQINPNDVEIVGIDVDKDPQKGMKFQKKLKENNQLNFRVINDPQNLIIAEFKPIGMPSLYYIKDKKVIKIITGAIDSIDEVILNDLQGMR